MTRKAVILSIVILQGLFAMGKSRHAIDKLSVESIIKHVSLYHDSISGTMPKSATQGLYTSFHINVDKRNATLMLIPSMYAIAKGDREYVAEIYSDITVAKGKIADATTRVATGTIPKNRDVMTIIKQFALPTIYSESIFGEFLLSPCNKYNIKAYRYKITKLTANRAEVAFTPKVRNTQLVSGRFVVNLKTGKIMTIKFKGELDMVRFAVSLKMNTDSSHALEPKTNKTSLTFNFMGNRVRALCSTYYNCQKHPAPSISNSHDRALMDSIRPTKLTPAMEAIYKKKFANTNRIGKAEADSANMPADGSGVQYELLSNKNKILNKFSDYFLERINGKFGSKERGTYRISPLINPLYLGYSNKRGVTYRMKMNAGYSFNDMSSISLTLNAGYSFKQHQFYTRIPMRLTINKQLYVETIFGIGNRITSSEILNKIKHESYDSVRWENMSLNYFKDTYWNVNAKYSFNNKWSIKPGFSYHRRSAVDKSGFILSGQPAAYYSFAPMIQLQYKPLAERGPVISVDYEHGIKGIIKSNTNYERIETDVAWKIQMHRMKLWSMKVGYGMYTSRSRGAYFLDYTNFRYENIPGGWDDDWTGEFQLLNSNWYNASEYYIRGNFTYESPLLILSRIPLIGRYIETERLYSNILFTDKLHPYIEYGYGMTNKLFSAGVFFSVSNKTFSEAGIRFGLELFRDW